MGEESGKLHNAREVILLGLRRIQCHVHITV